MPQKCIQLVNNSGEGTHNILYYALFFVYFVARILVKAIMCNIFNIVNAISLLKTEKNRSDKQRHVNYLSSKFYIKI